MPLHCHSKTMDILFIGFGNMAKAMAGAMQRPNPCRLVAYKPNPPTQNTYRQINGMIFLKPGEPLPTDFAPNLIILAFKPKDLTSILPLYQNFPNAIYLSLLAGKDLATLSQLLGKAKKIIRAMPNLAIAIGQGLMALSPNQHCHADDLAIIKNLWGNVSFIEIIPETKQNEWAALTGCSPGFIFYMLAMVEKNFEQYGYNKKQAHDLTLKIFFSSLTIAKTQAQDFHQLIKAVASKGGMTEAGLEPLMQPDSGFLTLWQKATQAALEKAKKL